MKIVGLGTLLVLTAALAHAGEKFPKCFDANREGHCVAVRVNGQSTVGMTKKTKKALEARGSLNFGNCDARHEVPLPVRGDLDLRFDWIPEAVATSARLRRSWSTCIRSRVRAWRRGRRSPPRRRSRPVDRPW